MARIEKDIIFTVPTGSFYSIDDGNTWIECSGSVKVSPEQLPSSKRLLIRGENKLDSSHFNVSNYNMSSDDKFDAFVIHKASSLTEDSLDRFFEESDIGTCGILDVPLISSLEETFQGATIGDLLPIKLPLVTKANLMFRYANIGKIGGLEFPILEQAELMFNNAIVAVSGSLKFGLGLSNVNDTNKNAQIFRGSNFEVFPNLELSRMFCAKDYTDNGLSSFFEQSNTKYTLQIELEFEDIQEEQYSSESYGLNFFKDSSMIFSGLSVKENRVGPGYYFSDNDTSANLIHRIHKGDNVSESIVPQMYDSVLPGSVQKLENSTGSYVYFNNGWMPAIIELDAFTIPLYSQSMAIGLFRDSLFCTIDSSNNIIPALKASRASNITNSTLSYSIPDISDYLVVTPRYIVGKSLLNFGKIAIYDGEETSPLKDGNTSIIEVVNYPYPISYASFIDSEDDSVKEMLFIDFYTGRINRFSFDGFPTFDSKVMPLNSNEKIVAVYQPNKQSFIVVLVHIYSDSILVSDSTLVSGELRIYDDYETCNLLPPIDILTYNSEIPNSIIRNFGEPNEILAINTIVGDSKRIFIGAK